MPGSFFDTNVLVYMTANDPRKARRSADLVLQGGTISVQILNEVVNVGRRKLRMSWLDLHAFLSALTDALHVVPLSIETHEKGLLLAERYGLSTFDAMIVAAALIEGCDTLWSEDMHHGLRIVGGGGGLQIANPFRDA